MDDRNIALLLELEGGMVSIDTFTHEVFHAVCLVMHAVDHEFCMEHQEPHAYLNGHINNEIMKLCNDNKIEIGFYK